MNDVNVFPSKNGDAHEGMSLRNFFAISALKILLDESYWPLTPESLTLAAETAYKVADAMILASKATSKGK